MRRKPRLDAGWRSAERDAAHGRWLDGLLRGGHAVHRCDLQLPVGPLVDLRARHLGVQHGTRALSACFAKDVRCAQRVFDGEQPGHIRGGHLADRVTEHDARLVAGGSPTVRVEDV
eukprot:2053648-Prymnesium_polylepis.2